MTEAVQLVKTNFAQRSEIQALVGSRCFFVVGPQKSLKNWIVYTLNEQGWFTKDRVMAYGVRVVAEGKNIDDVLAMTPVIRDIMQDLNGLKASYIGSSDIAYTQDATAQVQLTFEIMVDITP